MTQQCILVNAVFPQLRCGQMVKEDRLTFRVDAHLKRQLERVAETENRSVAQVCEAFLRRGLELYAKHGSRLFTHRAEKDG